MTSYEEAVERIRSLGGPLGTEQVSLDSMVGRVAAEPVLSPEPVPTFDNSAMDGFAVHATDLPGTLKVVGTVAAGETGESGGKGTAVEILTGAPVPAGYDAVQMVEKSTRIDEGTVEFLEPVELGRHIRRAGEDYREGDTVVEAGTVLRPEHVMALASLGVARIPVYRRPRVSLISTGKELVAPETRQLPPGAIRNSTASYLELELAQLGCQPTFHGRIPDDTEKYRTRMEGILDEGPDVIVSTGAVSVGKFDFVRDLITDMGAKVQFHRVAIRPGKPVLYATFEGSGGRPVHFFGLPGNPVSTAVALRFFVEPLLRTHCGRGEEVPLRMRLMGNIVKPEGLRCFFKARACREGVESLSGQQSFKVKPMLAGNAWVVLPEGEVEINAGREVDVYPIHSWGAQWPS